MLKVVEARNLKGLQILLSAGGKPRDIEHDCENFIHQEGFEGPTPENHLLVKTFIEIKELLERFGARFKQPANLV